MDYVKTRRMIGINFVIIDLEFNNIKGLEKYFPELMQKEGVSLNNECPNEIIQIGEIKLDKNLTLIDSFEAHVKPVVYSVFNPVIKELTGISEEDLEGGVGFTDIMELLRTFIDKDSILCSWAKDDINEIIRNCSYHKYYDIQWIKAYIDLQDYSFVMDQKLIVQGFIRRKIEIDNGIYEYGVEFQILDSQRKNILKVIDTIKARMNRRASFRTVCFCIKDKMSCLHSKMLIG